jgi:poly-gamma-glutamate synthesis protein (capsule biosynthesis protein)
MQDDFTIAVTGDAIINRRISVSTDERFLSLVRVIRDADVGYTNLETVIHDYRGPEVHPAAEIGNQSMRSPRFAAEELKWAGFDMVSNATNHTLDYSYGGMRSTWKALDEAGLAHAGSGENLGEARAPVYLDTAKGRVALISMTPSYAAWAKAGDVRPDVGGRPGINPLGFHYVVDADTMKMVKELYGRLGYAVSRQGKGMSVSPPGLSPMISFVQGDAAGMDTAVDEDDAEGNLRAIREARRQADWVVVTVHNHWCRFHPDKGCYTPPGFVTSFARASIEAGADIFVEQGHAHVPLRGIEVYRGKPVIYNPGDFMNMSETVTRLPADCYWRPGLPPELRSHQATPGDYYDAREGRRKYGVESDDKPPFGAVIAVCSFDRDRRLSGVKLHPFTHVSAPRSQSGLPIAGDAAMNRRVLDYLAKVSSLFGTKITSDGDGGRVEL